MSGKLNVLIAFECSGVSRRAFKQMGHNAWSLDLQPADDNDPNHMQCDAIEYLQSNGDRWDLIILHPPCTALALSGNRWYGVGKPKHDQRLAALSWTIKIWRTAIDQCNYVALENPVGVLGKSEIGKATQYVQPYEHGHEATKTTGLWLHNLPRLKPTNVVGKGRFHVTKGGNRLPEWYNLPPGPKRAKIRSQTFQGIAEAWAEQWSKHILNQRNHRLFV